MKTKIWNALFISGLVAATTVGITVPLALNLKTPLTPIQQAEYRNNYQLLKDSSFYQVNQLTGQDNKLLFSQVIEDIENRKILLLAFDHATVLIDLRTGITIETSNQTLNIDLAKVHLFFGGSLGILLPQAYFYRPLDGEMHNGIPVYYYKEDLLKNQLFISPDISEQIIQQVFDKRVEQAKLYLESLQTPQTYGIYQPYRHVP